MLNDIAPRPESTTTPAVVKASTRGNNTFAPIDILFFYFYRR